jgi:hypothetical protein
MESQSQDVDRILKALSPALATEVEKIVAETRQSLEAGFEKRLQEAVQAAEASARKTVEAQLEHAVTDAREKVRQQVTAEMQDQFKKSLNDTTGEIRSRLEEDHKKTSSGWAAEREQLLEQIRDWRTFAEALPQLVGASSQPEILLRFLKMTEPFAGALAIYVAKADGLALWKSRGKTAFPPIISQQTADPESFFRLIGVREKTLAAVYAARPFRTDALQFMCGVLERSIEMFGLKLRTPVPQPPAPPQASLAQAAAAFAGQSGSSDEQQVHAEARKTARLLISEIKLYHEQEVREGRANSDLYQRLRKEIDRGRDSYNQRVPAALSPRHDYFHEELVRILTENEPSRLGDAYPGPAK